MRTAVPTAAGGEEVLAAWKTHDTVGLTRLLYSSLVARGVSSRAFANRSPGSGRTDRRTDSGPSGGGRAEPRDGARHRRRRRGERGLRLLVDPAHELAQLLAGGLQQVLGVLLLVLVVLLQTAVVLVHPLLREG